MATSAADENSGQRNCIMARLAAAEEVEVVASEAAEAEDNVSMQNRARFRRRSNRGKIGKCVIGLQIFSLCSFILMLLLLLLAAVTPSAAFNVDVASRIVHSGPRGTCDGECMFGFAVAQHRERGTPW
jgi:hypothetical protein